MSMTGRVTNLIIKDDNKPNALRRFNDGVTLELDSTKSKPNIFAKIPPDDLVILEFNLKDCSYNEDGSQPGKVECIQIDSTEHTVIIMDKDKECVELLNYVRKYLRNQAKTPPSRQQIHDDDDDDEPKPKSKPKLKPESELEPEPAPVSNEKVTALVEALNAKNVDRAAQLARDLARQKASIRLALGMNNESGNAPQRQPSPPRVQPLNLKLSIESFLVNDSPSEPFNVAILPGTTIKELKQLVNQNANIPVDHQYWYINRELLADTYEVGGNQQPKVMDNAVFILYITKPQQPN